MIPRSDLQLESAIPEGNGNWTPKRDDLGEEAFGNFRDTWLIRGVGIREAHTVIDAESALLTFADRQTAHQPPQ
jgi:hypothetical protein